MRIKRNHLKKIIKDNYEKNPLEGYAYYNASTRLHLTKRLHNIFNKPSTDNWMVDNITWDDLEMDQVFLRINHTNSFIGEQMLYHKLHLLNKEKSINTTQNIWTNEDERINVEMSLAQIGKREESYYLVDFLMNTQLWKINNPLIYHFLQLLLISLLFIGILSQNSFFFLFAGIIAAINIGIYSLAKQKYEIYLNSLGSLKDIYNFVSNEEKRYKNQGKKFPTTISQALKHLSKLSHIIVTTYGRKQTLLAGDISALLIDYIYGAFLIDISIFNYILTIISNKQEDVLTLLEYVGQIDSEIAISSYRKSIVNSWCEPSVLNEGHHISVQGLTHPLITNPIANDIEIKNRILLTGSNASGKSTFMKAIAINLILAQTIHTCTAASFSYVPVEVMTCMALRDDIISGESYYFREAKCLKRMLDRASNNANLFIIIDEILKGTNTKERIAASKAILSYLGEQCCFCIVATHDIELTNNKNFSNFHFRSTVESGDISFDYKLHKGICQDTNAIALLSLLGYPKYIITKAMENFGENR